MRTHTSLLIALFFIFSSCSKVDRIENTSGEIDNSKISKEIEKHSEGLDYFYLELQKNAKIKTKSGSNIANEILSNQDLNRDFLLTTVSDFLAEKKIDKNAINVLKHNMYPLVRSKSSNNETQLYSYNFYKIANDIININGSSINQVQSALNEIYNSTEFYSLTYIEKTIITVGGETYLDSYKYWESNIEKWDDLLEEINPKFKSVKTKGWWDTVKSYAKADAKGAVSGAIGGAAGGAVVGAVFAGVGAGPGALTGAVGGGVGTGVSASIDKALASRGINPIFLEEETGLIFEGSVLKVSVNSDSDILVPSEWIY